MNQQLSPERLAAISEREQAATPGPWRYGETEGVGMRGRLRIAGADHIQVCDCEAPKKPDNPLKFQRSIFEDYNNADFIIAARQDIPDLLAALRSAYAEIERLHGLGLDKISQLGQEIEAYQKIGKLEGVMAEVKRVWADFDGTQSMSPDAYLVVNRIGEVLEKAKEQGPAADDGMTGSLYQAYLDANPDERFVVITPESDEDYQRRIAKEQQSAQAVSEEQQHEMD